MAVPTVVTDLSVTANSNSPAGADAVASGTGPDDYLRALSAIVRREQAQATAVASATTVDLGAITTGNYVHITGTTTITGFGTVAAGVERTVVFDGALTLTHNATSLILGGGSNITTAAGDVAVFRSEGSGNWRCVSYSKTSPGATETVAGLAELATTAECATGTATNVVATPAGVAAGIAALGLGGSAQSWQNMTASRALNTNYTNSTGKPICVSVSLLSTADNSTAKGVVGGAIVTYSTTLTSASLVTSVQFIVPAGSTYSVGDVAGTHGIYTASGWMELR